MDHCFCIPLNAKPKLLWCQETSQLLFHFVPNNLSNETAEGTMNSNEPNNSISLCQGGLKAPKK